MSLASDSSASPVSPLLETRELSRRFGQRWAFARVDLTVGPGDRLLLMGGNGSGKTTMLRVFSTLLRPSHGELRIFGLDPLREPMAVRSRLALLGHATGLYEDLDAMDNLTILARIGGHTRYDPADLLQRVGLDPRRKDPMRAFSAGMRKRLQVAALLLQDPDLVLLDEPFTALDPKGCDQIGALLSDLRGAIIIASHQLRRASALCKRAVLLADGVPRWRGPASDAERAWETLHPGERR